MKSYVRTYFVVMQILDLLLGISFIVGPIAFVLAAALGAIYLGNIGGYLLLVVPLLFITMAIFLFIASSKFGKAKRKSDQEIVEARGNLLGWGIFSSIMLAPSILGFLVLIVIVILVNNQILNYADGKVSKPLGTAVKEGAKATVDGTKEVFGVKSKMQQQKEELEELKSWKETGLITEEEYNAKRKQILGI